MKKGTVSDQKRPLKSLAHAFNSWRIGDWRIAECIKKIRNETDLKQVSSRYNRKAKMTAICNPILLFIYIDTYHLRTCWIYSWEKRWSHWPDAVSWQWFVPPLALKHTTWNMPKEIRTPLNRVLPTSWEYEASRLNHTNPTRFGSSLIISLIHAAGLQHMSKTQKRCCLPRWKRIKTSFVWPCHSLSFSYPNTRAHTHTLSLSIYIYISLALCICTYCNHIYS